MVDCVSLQGRTIEATATRFKIDSTTVRKWRDRFVDEGSAASPTESALERNSSFMSKLRYDAGRAAKL